MKRRVSKNEMEVCFEEGGTQEKNFILPNKSKNGINSENGFENLKPLKIGLNTKNLRKYIFSLK